MSQLTARRFERADRDACARIFERVQREVFAGDDPALYRARRFERDTEGEEIWVAEIGGEIVGLATLWRRQPFVHYLLIDRAARGRGVGRALLDSMLAGVGGPVDLKCRTTNLAARRFYERLGWTEVERVEDAAAPYVRYRLDHGVTVGDARRDAASRRRPIRHATAR